MTRVLVAAASAVVRAGLESIINAHPGCDVVGSVTGTVGLAHQIEATQPDVVLVDLERSQNGSVPGSPAFAEDAGTPGMVLLVDDADDADIAAMLKSGVRAVLSRDAGPEEIMATVDATAVGLVVLHQDAASLLLSLVPAGSRVAASSEIEALTPREIEVLVMLAEGEGNKTIARRLGISEHTVKFHVGSILAKMHASSRTEAVTLGVRQGLIMV
ncbi:MAG: response regulator transcription factor [Chloroflexota bacterium]